MALDPGVLAEIRSWVGDAGPSDEDLEERFSRLSSGPAVAFEVLRGRLADMLTKPPSFSIEGDYSESGWDRNIVELRRQVARLDELVAGGNDEVTVGQLVRDGRSR